MSGVITGGGTPAAVTVSEGDAHDLLVEVLDDALTGAFPADAALFDAAKGHGGRGRVDVIDADDPEVEPLGDRQGPRDVLVYT